jgi:hypothetical protein
MNVTFGGTNGTVVGQCNTTTSTPVLTFAANGGLSGKAYITIKRAVGTSVYYKIDGYLSSHPSSIVTALVSETSMTTDVTYNVLLPYARVVVSLRDNVGANTYQVDYMVY